MKFIRFVFPFLFQRNWVTGEWELSRSRFLLFIIVTTIVLVFIAGAVVLQIPVTYESNT